MKNSKNITNRKALNQQKKWVRIGVAVLIVVIAVSVVIIINVKAGPNNWVSCQLNGETVEWNPSKNLISSLEYYEIGKVQKGDGNCFPSLLASR